MIGIHRLTAGLFGLTLLLVTAGACGKEVTQLQNGQEPAPANTSDNSNALLMPAGTNAAAAVALPAELVSFETGAAKSTPLRAEISPNDKSPKIFLDCAEANLPKDKNLKLVALIENNKVRFRGETEQFIFDGTQTSRLSL